MAERNRKKASANYILLTPQQMDNDTLINFIEKTPTFRRGSDTRLREQREHALLWRQLTTIALDAPLGDIAHGHARGPADGDMLAGLSDALRFGPMTRRRLRAAAGLQD